MTLTFDRLTLKVVACDVGYLCANFGFLGLSILELFPMYATDRRQTNVRRRTKTSLNVSALGAGHNKILTEQKVLSLD